MNFEKMFLFILIVLPTQAEASMAACEETCGNVNIIFPFGTKEGCYLNNGFEVTCNNSFTPPKPFITSIGMELLEVQFSSGEVRVNNPVISSGCNRAESSSNVSLSGSSFIFSDFNKFGAWACNNYAMLHDGDTINSGCLSICDENTECRYGLNCCLMPIPPNIISFQVNMTNVFNKNSSNECKSAFIFDPSWLDSQQSPLSLNEVKHKEYVPAVLKWAHCLGYCYLFKDSPNTFNNSQGCLWSLMNERHLCVCSPYSATEDQNQQNKLSCDLYCVYTPESSNCSSCPNGYFGDGNGCYPLYDSNEHNEYIGKRSRIKIIIIGCGSGLGFLLLLISSWCLYKLIKRRNDIKLKKKKNFKRNGGLLLQQKNNVENTKLFLSEELEKATDNFHFSRIVGQGGQGTVYKGMLIDGRTVAVKKSKAVDEGGLQQFINELVILSQINHRNVVKLHGCCLETEVPLLVYEFISNGTLFQHIHDPSEEFPITWEMRLRIATEVANAVSYLHSAASVPVYHRDIKSTNILLDDKYQAKVSDFGTSKSITIDQTHVTTRVQGTFGYLDPEYFQSSQFTEKSDVYSFGVVLVELLTGQKPISSTRSIEERNLVAYFLLSMEENRLLEIFDPLILKEGRKEEIIAVAELAKRCLNSNGKRRPTMKTVAMELEAIRTSEGACSVIEEVYQVEEQNAIVDITGTWDAATLSSTESCLFGGR